MTLREKVAEAIHWDVYGDTQSWGDLKDWEQDLRKETADAAIATVFEALLSDTAVEAGAEGVYQVDGEGLFIFQDGKERRVGWGELTTLHRAQVRARSRAALKAAQAALTADDAQTGEPQ